MNVDDAARLKEEFRKLDRNGDGTLSFNEISVLLRKGMSTMGHKEVQALFDEVDKNQNGRIEFDEFVDYIHSTRPLEPGPATYSPNVKADARHTNAPKATIDSGPGHILPGDTRGGPGPGAYHLDEQQPSIRLSRSSSGSIGKGPGHEPLMPRPTPGPGDYEANDKAAAHCVKEPSVIIGSGPGHRAPADSAAPTPGPLTYNPDPNKAASIVKAARATIGHGPGHVSLAPRSDSPGPGAYSWEFMKMSGQRRSARATIGHGPGHRVLDFCEGSPGPAAYAAAGRARICGGSLSRAPSADFIQTMRNFRETDVNHDKKLDIDEVRALLLKGNPHMKEGDIKTIFGAVDCNGDGQIDFNELVDYLLPAGNADNALSRRKLKDAFAGMRPGPGSYNTAVRRDRIRGGGFGRAIRWT